MKTKCQSTGTCLGATKLCLAIVVCLSAIGYRSVQAVNCTVGSTTDCVASDFTSATCDAGQCSCNDKVTFLPIPTGCAAKPQVTYGAPDRTPEFLVGVSAPTLTCSTIDTGATISWEKDGTVINAATSVTYTITDTTAVGAGSYVCATTFGTEKIKSDPVKIKAVTSTVSPSAAPEVDGIPQQSADGVDITPLCNGIPYGATYKFELTEGDNNRTDLDVVTQRKTKMGAITCKINNVQLQVKNLKSVSKPWNTQIADDITAATVTITADKVASRSGAIQYFKTGTKVTANCVTTPASKYMVVRQDNATTFVYTFTDTGKLASELNTYLVAPASGNHTIACTATYGGKDKKTSASVTIIFKETYVAAPVLTSDPKSAVVPLGSRLVLTCGDYIKAQGVTYTWTKGGTVIPRQRDRIIQYGKFTAADVGKYVCTANVPTFTADSSPVDVKAAANSLHVLGSTLLLALVALASSKIL